MEHLVAEDICTFCFKRLRRIGVGYHLIALDFSVTAFGLVLVPFVVVLCWF